MLEDTIVAISTPPGCGGLGIVRLSGKSALPVARKIFRPRQKGFRRYEARRAVFGHILDERNSSPLDEAFLTYFRGPRSYTGEDVVELSCHGSPIVLDEIVRLGIKAGARPAQPGEFTLRAHLNGRLDILQAEAVNDFIRAASLSQARISFRQFSGGLSRRLDRLRRGLVRLTARLEAAIEFPEERPRSTGVNFARSLGALISEVRALVAGYEVGRVLVEGLTVAITGRANVGKSTLFNALLGEDRALVTPYPGTTRDYLREKMVVGDYVFNLVDMAGWGMAANPVEKLGMARGVRIAREADGLLLVLDASRKETAEDEGLLKRSRNRKKLVVLNKTDLAVRIDKGKVAGLADGAPVIDVSALRGRNIDRLKEGLLQILAPAAASPDDIILHARQKDILRDILEDLERAEGLLTAGHSEEICAEEVRGAVALIGQLTGEIRADEVLGDIFKRFCVGK